MRRSSTSSSISGFDRINLESATESSDNFTDGINETTCDSSAGTDGFDLEAFVDEYAGTTDQSAEIPEVEEVTCSNILVRGMEKNFARGRIIHDIFPVPNECEAERFVDYVKQTGFHGGIFIVAYHVDHLHVIHDCDYSGLQCRCVRVTNYWKFKKKNRRHVRRGDVTYTYLWNLAKYFLLGSRSYMYIEIGGYNWLECYSTVDISVFFDCCERHKRLVETYEGENDICHANQYGSCTNDTAQVAGTSGRKDSGRKTRERSKEEDLLQFCRKYPTSPLKLITTRNEFLESEFKFLDLNSNILTNIERIFAIEVMNYSTVNLYDYYLTCYPTFNATHGQIENFYYPVDASVNYLEEFLLHQFGMDSMEIFNFLTNLLNICDRRIPKINCLQIFGPPCSGKNWFFDCVCAYYLFVGYIGNFNKYCSFPLMECVNKRMLMWNEPNCEPGSFDTIKMLFGGDNLTVKVKYQGDGLVCRTPVIVLGNYNPFPTTDVFSCRTYTYNFVYCGMLRDLKYKPHPLAYYFLLRKYNIL